MNLQQNKKEIPTIIDDPAAVQGNPSGGIAGDDAGRNLRFHGVRNRIADLPDQLPDGGLPHEQPGNIDRGQRGLHNLSLAYIIKTDDRNVLGNPDMTSLQRLYHADGDQIVIGKITAGKSRVGVNQIQHITHRPFNRGGQFMNNGIADRHSVLSNSSFKSYISLKKILNRIGRLQVAWLAVVVVNQIIRRKVSSLRIVDQNTAAVDGFKVRVQENHRDIQMKKLPADF